MASPLPIVLLMLTVASWIVSGEIDETKQHVFDAVAAPELELYDLNIRHTVSDVAASLGLPIPHSIDDDMGVFLNRHGIGILDKRSTFSNFDQEHLVELNRVVEIFHSASSFSDFIKRAGILRAHLNPHLYYSAIRAVVMPNRGGRFDLIYVPEPFNIAARSFFTNEAIVDAIQHAREGKPISTDIETFTTGTSADPEQRLSWFREDIGLNAFHHTIGLQPLMSYQYIYGGLFTNARYNVERLAAGLSRVKPLDFDREQIIIDEGYDPHISTYFGWKRPAVRPAGMILQDDTRSPDKERTIRKMRYIYRKLIDAVRTGFFINEQGESVPVTYRDLGKTAKGPAEKSVNPKLYGTETFAMMGHLLLSAITDPRGQYNQERGVVGTQVTALRDPVAYRWHETVNEIFVEFKEALPSYSEEDLKALVVIDDIKIQMDEAGSQKNVLETFMEKRKVDVGIDPSIAREVGEGKGPVEVGIERLNHKPFHYHISVLNKNPFRDFSATVRIFIAPTNDETGTPFMSLNEQRQFFIEMDKFVVKLHPGNNVVKRPSGLSSVSHPVLLTPEEQRQHRIGMPGRKPVVCGWPQNLLVPRGTTSGMDFDVFAMITDWNQDHADEMENADDVTLRSGAAMCGLGSSLYNPDKRPMGFPFDRKFRDRDLCCLVDKYDNMIQSKITIYHRE